MRRAKRIGATAVRFNLTPLSDLQAALAVAQWRRLPAMLARRRILAGRYLRAIQDLPGIVAPSDDFLSRATHFRLPLRLDLRSMGEGDRILARFAAAGVAVRRPVAALLAPARAVPTAARLLRQTLSLPLYPALSDADQGKVIAAARSILAGRQPFDGA
jgi:dTDP-4-amino-4,6-dideoxygalactose transaminase